MNGIVVAALVSACVWLGILTLVVVLVVRQIGLLTVRFSVASQALSVDRDGPEEGTRVPEDVLAELPELQGERAYLLLASATCDPCRQLVAGISEHRFDQRVTALVPGSEDLANELATLLPPGIRVVLDPEATRLAESLRIQSTPFVLEIERGTITGKAYLYDGASDFIEFVEPAEEAAEADSLSEVTK